MKTSILPLAAFGAALSLMTSVSAVAQSGGPYDLSWSTIDGGGGTSTGGPYSLSGTIGQPDAGGPMTGGTYSLIGGFWGGVSAIQTPGAPQLTVQRDLLTGAVTVSWPVPADGWVLDQTTALSSVPTSILWTQVGFPYQTNAGRISVSIPSPIGARYYRLRR